MAQSPTRETTTTDIKESILDTIGETPLVRLSRIAPDVRTQIVAKVELFNPGGSIKDRVAIRLIEAAERGGRDGRDGEDRQQLDEVAGEVGHLRRAAQ